jgi:lipoate-protein ligase A
VIQHGSLTFSVEADRHLGVFADPPVTPEAFRDRVVGMDELVDVDRVDAVATVEAALADWAGAGPDATVDLDASWTAAELERAEELVAEKYRDEEWIRTRPGSGGK